MSDLNTRSAHGVHSNSFRRERAGDLREGHPTAIAQGGPARRPIQARVDRRAGCWTGSRENHEVSFIGVARVLHVE